MTTQQFVLTIAFLTGCAAKDNYPISGSDPPDAAAKAVDAACPPPPCSMEATRTGSVVTIQLDVAIGAAQLVVLDRTTAPTLIAGVADFSTDLASLNVSSAIDAKLVAVVASTTAITCETVIINN